MKKIVAVIVTYNRCNLLKECIEKLLVVRNSNEIDIYVIDNASTDSTKECVDGFQVYDCVKYFNTGENLGGAGGFNYGIKKAYESGADYIWIMDDDTMVQPDSLHWLLKIAESVDNNFGWLSSLALWIDGNPCIMNYHMVATEWEREKNYILEGRLLCQAATFVSLLINRNAIKRKGLPISDYFIWGDDTEYTMRIAQDFPCYLVPHSQVIHKMKNNEETKIENMANIERINRMYYSIRNDLCTIKRTSFIRMSVFIIRQFASVLRIIKSNQLYKGRKILIIIKGVWAGLWFHPEIEYVD